MSAPFEYIIVAGSSLTAGDTCRVAGNYICFQNESEVIAFRKVGQVMPIAFNDDEAEWRLVRQVRSNGNLFSALLETALKVAKP